MKPGDIVKILPSCALTEMRLDPLVGMQATIKESVKNKAYIIGYWVTLPILFEGSYEWFIPFSSIVE